MVERNREDLALRLAGIKSTQMREQVQAEYDGVVTGIRRAIREL